MPSECIRTESAHGHIVNDGARVLILVELQIGVDQIVLPVHLITGRLFRLGRLHGGNIGRNRVFPESDAGEDMRGHVLRMRRSTCPRISSPASDSGKTRLRPILPPCKRPRRKSRPVIRCQGRTIWATPICNSTRIRTRAPSLTIWP